MSFKEWHQYTLDEVCILITDGSHTSPSSVENGYFMASVKDMTRFGFDFANCRKISEVDFLKLCKNGCSPQKGDVLIGKDGARYLEDILIFNQNEKVVILSSIAILRPDLSKINPRYLFYYLDNREMKKFIKSNYGSGSAIPRMVLKNFKKVPMTIPNIRNQEAIAHILSTQDEKIEVNNQINKTLEKIAQAIFKQWFVDFEFPNEDGEPYQSSGGEMVESELGLIPKGWEVGSFTDYIDVLSGGTPKTKNKEYWDGEIPFFTPKDTNGTYCICTEKSLTEDGLKSCNSKLYDENTVFITARGTVGKIAMAGIKMAMNQSCYALVGKGEMNQFYVWFQIKSAVEKLQRSASGSVFDAIIIDTFKSIKIIKPDTISIEQFRLIVEPVFQSIQSKYFENEKLKNIRDNLLPKLMAGEIRVSIEGKNNEIS